MEPLQLPGFDKLPTQIAQELYDPAHRLVSDPALKDSHEAFATFILDLYELTPETTGILLPCLISDAVESGLDTEEVLLARAEKQPEVSDLDLHEIIIPSVKHLVEGAQRQASHILEILDIERVGPNKRTLYAADQIAQASYEGKTRKTGEPYYQHPKRAAAMALFIFSQLEEEGYEVEPEFKDAVICATLLHDATEETIRSCKYYSPDRPKGFSPLLVREIFRQTGNRHGQTVANSLRLMTHYAKLEWAPDYETYVQLGSSDFIFDLVKTLDMGDNLLHPKPITENMGRDAKDKIDRKRTLYSKLIGTMAINAAQRSDSTNNRIWSPRYFEIFRTIGLEKVPAMVQELNMYIYGDTEEIPLDTAENLRPGMDEQKFSFPLAA